MTVFDVLVNTDDLVVLGPPDIVDVYVGIGEKGARGATFYAGEGSPNISSVSENIFGENLSPIAGDVFINTAIGPQYGWMYIYNPKVVGNQWDQVLVLQPPLFSTVAEVIFSSGEATISFPLSNIIPEPTGVTEDNFVINITAQNNNPTVITVSSKTIVSSELRVSVSGIEFSSSNWQNVSKTLNLNINITTV